MLGTHDAGFRHDALVEWKCDACATLLENVARRSLRGISKWKVFLSRAKRCTSRATIANQRISRGAYPLMTELHRFELAATLSVNLIKEWLAAYKLKDGNVSETTGNAVTEEYKKQRAEEIATALNNHERWSTHGRGIHMQTLRAELKLKVDDFGEDEALATLVSEYFGFLRDYLLMNQAPSFVHSRSF